MKLKHFLTYIIVAIFSLAVALPQQALAVGSTTAAATSAKKTSKKKTTKKTTSAKSSSKKKKATRKKTTTRKSSYSATTRRTTTRTTAAADPVPTDVRQTVAAAETKKDNKRKIKVEKPDLDQIKRITLDPTSPFYFPKLKKKYETNDTTMTPEEFRNFYLGYMFQEDFDPYRVSPYSSITDELRNKPTHTREEIDTITKYAQLALQDNPFDLRQMSFLIHVLKERRKDMSAKIWEYRLENLLGAIKSTGTGQKTEDAWYVMYPSHEYDMVQLLGYEAIDVQYIEPGYDYLVVQPDESDTRKRDKSAKGFYFNVMMPQQQYELKHPDEMEATTEQTAEQAPASASSASAATTEEPNPDDIPAE